MPKWWVVEISSTTEYVHWTAGNDQLSPPRIHICICHISNDSWELIPFPLVSTPHYSPPFRRISTIWEAGTQVLRIAACLWSGAAEAWLQRIRCCRWLSIGITYDLSKLNEMGFIYMDLLWFTIVNAVYTSNKHHITPPNAWNAIVFAAVQIFRITVLYASPCLMHQCPSFSTARSIVTSKAFASSIG